jgi:hypothetical protein
MIQRIVLKGSRDYANGGHGHMRNFQRKGGNNRLHGENIKPDKRVNGRAGMGVIPWVFRVLMASRNSSPMRKVIGNKACK